MIHGSDSFYKLMCMLQRLDLGYRPAFTSEVMDYCVHYSGHTMLMWDSQSGDMDEFEPTSEELEALVLVGDAYADEIMDDLDDLDKTILGEEDE